MSDKKKPGKGEHSPLDEDGEVFEDPWMWVDPEDEEQAKTEWQQGTGTDLTPRKD